MLPQNPSPTRGGFSMNNIMKAMNQINNKNKQKHEENNKNPKTKISWADNRDII